MPNHVTTIIEFENCTFEEFNEIVEKFSTVRTTEELENMWNPVKIHFPDFNKVIPQPENLFKEDLGVEDRKKCEEQGIPNWYDWNVNNWGTKWNSYDNYMGDCSVKFNTAWSFPFPVVKAISEAYPDVILEVRYADEDMGHNCGQLTFQNGIVIDDNSPIDGTDDAVEFACEVNGLDYQEYISENY